MFQGVRILGERDAIFDLMGTIYDASLDPELWPEVVSGMRELLDCHFVNINFVGLRDTRMLEMISTPIEQSYMDAYLAYYQRLDPWVEHFTSNDGQPVLTNPMMFDIDTFRRSEFYNEFLRPQGSHHFMGSKLVEADGHLGAVGLFRGPDRDDFAASEIRMLEFLRGHLARALKIGAEIGASRKRCRFLLDLVNEMASPIVVADGQGNVVLANERAEAILSRQDCLRVTRGAIDCRDRSEGRKLRTLVARAAGTVRGASTRAGGAMTVRRRRGRPVHVVVVPFRPRLESGVITEGCAAIVIGETRMNGPHLEHCLRTWYSLTPSEARIAALLADGKSVTQISDALGVTRNTVKTHLKGVYAKSECRRQADFIRKVALSAATVLQPRSRH